MSKVEKMINESAIALRDDVRDAGLTMVLNIGMSDNFIGALEGNHDRMVCHLASDIRSNPQLEIVILETLALSKYEPNNEE